MSQDKYLKILIDSQEIITSFPTGKAIHNDTNGKAYRCGEYDVKILSPKKGNISLGEKKARDFIRLTTSHIFLPQGIVLDEEDRYVGVARHPKEIDEHPGKISLGVIGESIVKLKEDLVLLNRANVRIEGLTQDSYLYTQEGLNMCGVDEFTVLTGKHVSEDGNEAKLRKFVAKMIYYRILKEDSEGVDLRKLKKLVIQCSKDPKFLDKLTKTFASNPRLTLEQYSKHFKEKYLKR